MHELPLYKCHKEVGAFKIASIKEISEGWLLNSVLVSSSYMKKHEPYVGGYYVKYKDEYESFSPADVFEDGYTLIK